MTFVAAENGNLGGVWGAAEAPVLHPELLRGNSCLAVPAWWQRVGTAMCRTVRCDARLCHAVPCSAVPRGATQCHAVLFHAVFSMRCCAMQCCSMQCRAMQFRVALCHAVPRGAQQHHHQLERRAGSQLSLSPTVGSRPGEGDAAGQEPCVQPGAEMFVHGHKHGGGRPSCTPGCSAPRAGQGHSPCLESARAAAAEVLQSLCFFPLFHSQ